MLDKRISGIYDKNDSNFHKSTEIPKYATTINSKIEIKDVNSCLCNVQTMKGISS